MLPLMLTKALPHAILPLLVPQLDLAAPAASLNGARLTPEEQGCLTAYTSTLSGAIAGAAEVVDPLRGLLHADVTIADEVWTRTLEVAWATFSDRNRAEFSGVAGSLLAKPWHTKAMNLPPLMQGSHSVSAVFRDSFCWCFNWYWGRRDASPRAVCDARRGSTKIGQAGLTFLFHFACCCLP